jgi:hypothetical protein
MVAWRQLLSQFEADSTKHCVAQVAEDVVAHKALGPSTLSIVCGACDEFLNVSVGPWFDLLHTLD